jgi:hypothetical protein
MRILIEDDELRRVAPSAHARGGRCRADRPLAGSVEYDGIRLCNACATRFEVARLSGRVRSCAAFADIASATVQ